MVNRSDAGWTAEDEAYLLLCREDGVKYADIAIGFPSGIIRSETACWSRYNYLIKPPAPIVKTVVKKVVKYRPDYAREIMVPDV